ncbi:MAG: aspartate aminotransferase family protein [Actinobacteria bacterium]|nr:aspartate aminotransferase family protein [Actinomycetota bacterium]MBT3746847.1 aspartate aminotransferase family protein [Actinomycetota bacterium]MBT3969916.1 aspartate aminotransferase family protein [Actinomycetota bacterium]MBT4009217.1 aspartate aminotransferase family protein [Actinomycetota bacterium]MBT4303497.1 aspartate aminotransferase family protein [Actinomycetota bacterium]
MSHQELVEKAEAHLWGHFSVLNNSVDGMRVIERGDGCYLWDTEGNRYFDGLSGLFLSQLGHGRTELAKAAGDQAATLGYFPIWTYGHPTAIELAAKLAEFAPGDINRVFFTTGGSEAVESAWKLARQYFKLKGQPERTKVISRNYSYHGTTMGALSITGLDSIKTMFEPLVPGAIKVPETNHYRCPLCQDEPHCSLHAADAIEEAILAEGPETIAAVFLEPVQNAGGCFEPPPGYFARVREICDKYGVLLVSDEVICAFGRIGYMFGCQRYGYQPDMITTAKGLTSGYSPLGALLVSDKVAEPFVGTGEAFLHGITFAGHPVSCAVALANLEIFEKEDICGHVRNNEDAFRTALEDLTDLPIVGDVRGAGYFYAIELVKDRATRESFSDAEREHLLRGFFSNRLLELGLICRADDRGEPVIQLSPPLISGPDDFAFISTILRQALTEAMAEMERWSNAR